jgi:hypothetical protein
VEERYVIVYETGKVFTSLIMLLFTVKSNIP